MLELIQPILNLLNAEFVIKAGYVLMTLIVFTETGLLIGFCLPGDSLLVTAGIFAAFGKLSLLKINALLIPAAILGDTLGYWIGYHTGPRLFRKPKSLLFNPEHLQTAQEFYLKHGGKTIILARFVPVIRTFAPLVAGMGRMNYRNFLAYNVFGGIGWIAGMSSLGYIVGKIFLPDPEDKNVAKRIEIVVIVVVLVSILPVVIPMIKHRLTRNSRLKPQIEPVSTVVADES